MYYFALAVCIGNRLFRKGRQGRQSEGVELYVKKRFGCTALTVSNDVDEILWVRIREMENKEDILVSVY